MKEMKWIISSFTWSSNMRWMLMRVCSRGCVLYISYCGAVDVLLWHSLCVCVGGGGGATLFLDTAYSRSLSASSVYASVQFSSTDYLKLKEGLGYLNTFHFQGFVWCENVQNVEFKQVVSLPVLWTCREHLAAGARDQSMHSKGC